MNEIVEEHEIEPTPVKFVDESADPLTEKLYSTDDAVVWAEEWCRIAREIEADPEQGPVVDEGWMVGWFANAMVTAETHARKRLEAKALVLDPVLGQQIIDDWTLHKLADEHEPTPGELLFVLLKASQ